MNHSSHRSEHAFSPGRTLLYFGFFALLALTSPARAATQVQTLNLAVGWNAVWLEVEPTDASGDRLLVNQVFQSPNFTIDVVARPVQPVGTAEFVDNPANTFNQPGWLVWYANPVTESDVFPIEGNRAYLVHVTPLKPAKDGTVAGTLALEGTVRFFLPVWTPGTFNLLGFPVSGALTFKDYLSALTSQNTLATGDGTIPTVQGLDPSTGAWVGVGLAQSITPGRAYWV